MKLQLKKRYGIAPAMVGALIIFSIGLSACATPAPTPTPTRTPRPIATSAPVAKVVLPAIAAAATTAPASSAAAEAAQPAKAAPTTTAAPAAAATALPPTATPAPAARLSVTSGEANARSGPGTAYPIVGTLSAGQWFEIVGKNAGGDWWQICCVANQRAWVAASVATVENTGRVPVVTDIPAAPTARPQAPTAVPPTQAPAASDPCANIGGDGCKFHVTGGPSSAANNGQELKLQLFFIHSGRNNEPQPSYFIVLEKDNQRLTIPDSKRSLPTVSVGPQGRYNYEYALGRSQLPGGTVAGRYVGWVLDGYGERDSQNFTFTLGEGQGEVWIQFDQN